MTPEQQARARELAYLRGHADVDPSLAFVLAVRLAETGRPEDEAEAAAWLADIEARLDADPELPPMLDEPPAEGAIGMAQALRQQLAWAEALREPGQAARMCLAFRQPGEPLAATVGQCFQLGMVAGASPARAAAWFGRAAEAGFVPAMITLAEALIGEGEPEAALAWLRRAGEAGDGDAAYRIADLAEQVDVRGRLPGEAQAVVAYLDLQARGLWALPPVDGVAAAFEAALAAGDPHAVGYRAAEEAATATADPADWEARDAAVWGRAMAAAAGGSPHAARLVPDREAAMAARAGAEAGDPAAMADWGERLLLGFGALRNEPAGLAWLERAGPAGEDARYRHLAGGRETEETWALAEAMARAGVRAAQEDLGLKLFTGLSMIRPQDHAAGLGWLYMAADQDSPVACHLIGEACRDGWGVPPDPEAARAWFARGAALGHWASAEALEAL